MTTDTYSVSYITNTMRGAPVINGNTPGCLLAVLDALLINGWGLAAASTLVVAGGIATATFANATPWDVGAVIEVGGATPAAINGRARVLASSGNILTFATAAGDGSYSGSIGIKYASAGWERVFAGANKAVYRSTDVTGARFYLRVDDSNGLYARVCGYESMSDADTGAGMYPAAAMIAGGGYWHKATASNATAIPYVVAADGRALLHALTAGAAANASNTACAVRGFGDVVPMGPAGDAFACVLSCAATSSGASYVDHGALSGSASDSSVATGLSVAPRSWQGLGSAVLQRPLPMTGLLGALSGAADYFGAAPSAIDGQVKTAVMGLKDQGAQTPLRGIIPGVHYIPQTGAVSIFGHLSVQDGAGALVGRKLLGVHVGTAANTPATGAAMIDLTGPWR